MPIDNFAGYGAAVIDPARAAFAITPDDGVALALLPRSIYVGSGGTLTLRAVDSPADVTLVNIASGQQIDIRPSHIRATGTTAANIVGLA